MKRLATDLSYMLLPRGIAEVEYIRSLRLFVQIIGAEVSVKLLLRYPPLKVKFPVLWLRSFWFRISFLVLKIPTEGRNRKFEILMNRRYFENRGWGECRIAWGHFPQSDLFDYFEIG
jgi:hypothetical protein